MGQKNKICLSLAQQKKHVNKALFFSQNQFISHTTKKVIKEKKITFQKILLFFSAGVYICKKGYFRQDLSLSSGKVHA